MSKVCTSPSHLATKYKFVKHRAYVRFFCKSIAGVDFGNSSKTHDDQWFEVFEVHLPLRCRRWMVLKPSFQALSMCNGMFRCLDVECLE